jgi:hypothetical protein
MPALIPSAVAAAPIIPAAASSALPAPAPTTPITPAVGVQSDSDSDAVWDDENDDDSDDGGDYDEEDDEYYSEDHEGTYDSDDSDDMTFPDGLPTDPYLPLLFISRPFLHATRERLYKDVVLDGPWHASLFLDAISAEEHAAHLPEENADSELSNMLSQYVRTLHFTVCPRRTRMTHARGGASVFIDIISLCDRVEDLSIAAPFLHTST